MQRGHGQSMYFQVLTERSLRLSTREGLVLVREDVVSKREELVSDREASMVLREATVTLREAKALEHDEQGAKRS